MEAVMIISHIVPLWLREAPKASYLWLALPNQLNKLGLVTFI
jgi:hypothetical protein